MDAVPNRVVHVGVLAAPVVREDHHCDSGPSEHVDGAHADATALLLAAFLCRSSIATGCLIARVRVRQETGH